jgi:uncharacterized protein YndB with AHSA1/START domain
MVTESLSATISIPAPRDVVFAALASPTTHAAISGDVGGTSSNRTGWVDTAVDTQPLIEPGQVFRMGMQHPNGSYQTANQVRELDPPHTIAWATGTEDENGELAFGGWFWRYELTEASPGTTEVRLTYDWSEATRHAREAIPFPPFGVEHLQDSRSRLAAVITS